MKDKDVAEKILINYCDFINNEIRDNLNSLITNDIDIDFGEYLMEKMQEMSDRINKTKVELDSLSNNDFYDSMRGNSDILDDVIGNTYNELKNGKSMEYIRPLYAISEIATSINNIRLSYVDEVDYYTQSEKDLEIIKLEDKNNNLKSLRKELLSIKNSGKSM